MKFGSTFKQPMKSTGFVALLNVYLTRHHDLSVKNEMEDMCFLENGQHLNLQLHPHRIVFVQQELDHKNFHY